MNRNQWITFLNANGIGFETDKNSLWLVHGNNVHLEFADVAVYFYADGTFDRLEAMS